MKAKLNGHQIVIIIFFTLFMAIMTMNLMVFPACAAQTMERYGITQTGLTTLSSFTSVVGLFGGFVFGPLLDRGKIKSKVGICMIIGIVLFYARLAITSYVLTIVVTFFASFFIGIIQIGASKILDTWFTKETVSVAYSVQAAGAGIGSSLAFIIGAAAGLQMFMLIISVLYTILLVIWLVAGGAGPLTPPEAIKPPKGSTKKAWTSKYMWCMSIAGTAIVGGTLLINTYVINAFVAKGLGATGASIMGTVMNLSLLIGGYFGSLLMALIKRYNVVTIIEFAVGGVGYLLCWFLPLGPATWIFIVIGGVVIGGAIGATIGRVALIPMTGQFPQEAVGTAAGAVETIKGALTFVIPILVANAFATNYNAVFIIFAIHCVVGIIFGGILVPELGPKGKIAQQAAAGGASEEK